MKSTELLFKWPHRHRIHLLLPAALILAAVAHAGIFFLFSVANPPLKPDGIHPARIYFLRKDSQELAQLESTLASNDPALFAPRHGSPIHTAFPATYIPQYATTKTALLQMPPREKAETTDREPLGPIAITKPKTLPRQAPERRLSPQLSASPELAARLPEIPKEIRIQKTRPDSLDTISFFVGIQSDGTVAHIVANNTTGDSVCDLQALQILKSLRLLPTEETRVQWGFVDFHIGASTTSPKTP